MYRSETAAALRHRLTELGAVVRPQPIRSDAYIAHERERVRVLESAEAREHERRRGPAV